jgi:hypothetical protein
MKDLPKTIYAYFVKSDTIAELDFVRKKDLGDGDYLFTYGNGWNFKYENEDFSSRMWHSNGCLYPLHSEYEDKFFSNSYCLTLEQAEAQRQEYIEDEVYIAETKLKLAKQRLTAKYVLVKIESLKEK